MLGISLSIAAATAVTLIGQTAMDAPSLANPVQFLTIVLRCGGLHGQYEVQTSSTHRWASFAQCAFGQCAIKHRARASGDLLDRYMEFPIDADPSWKMHIEWREQAKQIYSVYFITQEREEKAEIVDAGSCRESRELPEPSPFLPAPVRVRQSDKTANGPRAEIRVVTSETRETAAVITVSGHLNKGDNLRFFDAVEKK